METLNTIQKLSKLGKILSKIIHIFCIIGIVGCAVGIIFMAAFPDTFKLGGITVHNIIEKSAEVTVGTCYAAMAAGLIFCTGEAVLTKISENYFRYELECGTPFTFDGAKKLIKLGICTISIPLGTLIAASIAVAVIKNFMPDTGNVDFNDSLSIGLGIMMIVAGLLCRYGAEISENKKA